MSAARHYVTIKGVKDGLIFHLDDACPIEDVLRELKHKLEKTHTSILSGPLIHVRVKLGGRVLDDERKEEIRALIGQVGNLLVQSVESDAEEESRQPPLEPEMQIKKGMIRSGQTMITEGSVMLLGDVNPGGMIRAGGDIYVMGALKGSAHAGWPENEQAIIAASHLKPTQLRIAGVISRPPDEWEVGETYMEFAYVRDGVMEIDKIQNIQRIRPTVPVGEAVRK